jgi:hypothetical protein
VAAAVTPGVDTPTVPLVISHQGSFFVGGHDVASDALSTIPNFSSTGTITVDQMYVHYQVPIDSKGNVPLVLVHGCCLTGKTWETTPDGRMGWDEFFLRKGHPVYVVDQAERGRSAADPTALNKVKTGRAQPDSLPTFISAGRESAWEIFRFGPTYLQAYDGMQFPLEAQDEFWKQMVPDWSYGLKSPNPTVPALSELAKKIGRAVIVSHSQSGIYPFQSAALDNEGIAGIVSIEPGSCPGDDMDPSALKRIPTLILFGDNIGHSPPWQARLSKCESFAKRAAAAGVPIELVQLPDVGIHGNSHMLMLDRNSLIVADWLNSWIGSHVKP